jgi:hypothetical protein
MRAAFVVASILMILSADASRAAGTGTAPTYQALASATAATNNLTELSDDQIAAQLALVEAQRSALKAESARRNHSQSAKTGDSKGLGHQGKAAPAQSATGDTAHFQQLYLREMGYKNEALAAPPPRPVVPDPCNPQRLFIRQNSLDNYLYGITPASKAKGASISYTDDQHAGTQTATINAMVSYVALRDLCPPTPPGDAPFFSGYSIAPFVLGQGNYTQPQAKTEHSSLQFGVENQFEISRSWLPRQVFTIAPYVQTDYRDQGRASGVKAYWDPYDIDLHLGGYLDTDPYLGWFVQLRGEANEIQVSKVGVTNLSSTSYSWVGGTAALNVYFLPADLNVPDFIRNRFAFYATANYFTDTRSGMNIRYYTAKLSYKISSDGSSSVSVEYDNGTQKDTLVATRQWLASLTYAY